MRILHVFYRAIRFQLASVPALERHLGEALDLPVSEVTRIRGGLRVEICLGASGRPGLFLVFNAL